MRAREPDQVGDLDRDGVPVHYEVFGSGPATVMMLGCFPVVDGQPAVEVTVRGTIDAVFAGALPGGPDGFDREATATAVARVG